MRIFLIAICFFTVSLLVSMNVLSQSITSTIGTNGAFTIKNSVSTYFSLSQSSGQVNILKTLGIGFSSSLTGTLYMGANRFMHAYGSENTFLGENSGNFSISGP